MSYLTSLHMYGVTSRPHPDLISLANRFDDLQRRREIADYSSDSPFPSAGALTDVSDARRAYDELAALAASNDSGLYCFLAAMLFRDRRRV